MNNENIVSNKFGLNLETVFSYSIETPKMMSTKMATLGSTKFCVAKMSVAKMVFGRKARNQINCLRVIIRRSNHPFISHCVLPIPLYSSILKID